jgi:hypothetical protein
MYKLTLSIEEKIAGQAKHIASERNTSVSAMFSQWIQAVASGPKQKVSLGRITRQVSGVIQLPDTKSDKDVLAEALEDKYGLS